MSRHISFDFDSLAGHVLNDIGALLVDAAKKNMDSVSYGRAYIVHGKVHIASKAGDTANNMTGALRETIRYNVDRHELEFGAGNQKVNYAKYLEKGTSAMKPRPNYTKTIMQERVVIDQKVTQLFLDSLGAL